MASTVFSISIWTRNWVRRMVTNAGRAAQQRQQRALSTKDSAPLFVADTRPAMFPLLGVPSTVGVGLLMLFGESIIFIGPIWAFWVIIPWVICRVAVRQDYNMPRICVLWLQTKGIDVFIYMLLYCVGLKRLSSLQYWGGSSPSPWPLNEKHPRGIWA